MLLSVSDKKRDRMVNVRLTEEEYEWLVAVAEEAGLTYSDWLRQAIRKAIKALKK